MQGFLPLGNAKYRAGGNRGRREGGRGKGEGGIPYEKVGASSTPSYGTLGALSTSRELAIPFASNVKTVRTFQYDELAILGAFSRYVGVAISTINKLYSPKVMKFCFQTTAPEKSNLTTILIATLGCSSLLLLVCTVCFLTWRRKIKNRYEAWDHTSPLDRLDDSQDSSQELEEMLRFVATEMEKNVHNKY